MIDQTLLKLFPQFGSLVDKMGQHVLEQSNLNEIAANTTVFRQGDLCKNYFLIIEGSVKVFSRAENGREIVLYKIERGGSCVLTTTCLLGKQRYPAEGVTETKVKFLSIPGELILDAINTSPEIREFIFASHSERLSSLIAFISEVVFSRIDVRLAKYLLDSADSDNHIMATHQVLATELGSAREVISRQLKDFERRSIISISRGKIKLIDRDQLEAVSDGR
jgi:CRP/FNR family transcriptional regulator